MAEIANLMVKIGADTSGLKKGLGTMTQGIGRVGAGFARLGAAGALAIGGVLVGALGSGIKGISDMEDQTTQLDTVLKSTKGAVGLTAKALTDMATAHQLNTKFAEEDVLAGENLLLTFTNIGKDVFPQATTTLLDMATAMGGDASSNAIQLGKALNDPTKGISALTRVGVTFSEAQKKSIKTMQEHGDMAGAQKVILAELAKEFGGSAVAAGTTFSGQLIIAKNSVGEIFESLASDLMPELQKMLNWVNGNMPAIQAVFKKVFDVAKVVVTSLWTVFKEKVLPVLTSLYSYIKTNWPAIKTIFKTVFDSAVAVVKALWENFQNNILPVLKVFYDFIKTNWPTIKSLFETVFKTVRTIINAVYGVIKDNFLPIIKEMLGKITEAMPGIKAAIQKAFDYIKPAFDKLWAAVKDNLIPIITGMWDTVKKAIPGIKSIFAIVFPIIVEVIKTVIDTITNIIKVIGGIYKTIKPGLDAVANLFSAVFGAIEAVIKGVQSVLNLFNNTQIKDKKSTVTTKYRSTYSKAGLESYAVGTNYVPNDMVAQIHKGERIIPANQNNDNNTDKKSNQNNIVIHVNGVGDPDTVARAMVKQLRLQGVMA